MMKSKLCKSDIRENALHHEFVEILSKFPVREVKFFGNKVSLSFLGHRISDYAVTKTEEHVAEWSRKRKEIFIDKKINIQDRRKSFKALCVHELIEKFLVEKFGLKVDTEAHVIATKKEKEYLKSIGGNWRSHELIVYWDWHRLGEH
jgi:hypothetical protein